MRKIIKSKKGLSEIVSYVLLIVIAIGISVLVFTWLRSYVMTPKIECPDGVSIMLSEYSCDSNSKTIMINVTNNGFFGIDGINVRISNKEEGVPNYGLDGYGPDGKPITNNGTVYFFSTMQQGSKKSDMTWNYKKYTQIKRIQITPIRFETPKQGVKKEFVICNNAALMQDIENCD